MSLAGAVPIKTNFRCCRLETLAWEQRMRHCTVSHLNKISAKNIFRPSWGLEFRYYYKNYLKKDFQEEKGQKRPKKDHVGLARI